MALVAVLVAAGAAVSAPADTTAHPRIVLDPTTLATLRTRAQANTPEWNALKARCNALRTGTVEWPDGNDYPESNSVGEGYQGDGYLPAVLALGLCYQTGLPSDPTTATGYASRGVGRPHE